MDANKFVGMQESQAVSEATAAGLKVVVNRQVPSMLTASMQMDRLGLTVVNGVVTAASIG